MGLVMPNPVLIGKTYYLRVHVPADVAKQVEGAIISVPVDGVFFSVTIKGAVKVSLRTKDAKEAKRLFIPALAAVEEHWESVRNGPKPLTQKASLALAGAIRAAWVDAFDDEPGSPKRWQHVRQVNTAAMSGQLNPLSIPTEVQKLADLESRFGKITDAFLRAKGLIVAPESRNRLLQQVAEAMADATRVNLGRTRL